MRCLALAQAWKAPGKPVVFLSHCRNLTLRSWIKKAAIEFMELDRPHPDSQDLERTLGILGTMPKARRSWLAVDGYHFDQQFQKAVRAEGYRLLVIDDYAHLSEYDADIVLNQNPNAERLPYKMVSRTLPLFGPRFALLRGEFLAKGAAPRSAPRMARKILVTLGGSDASNQSLKVLEALCNIRVPGWEAVVVVGPENPNLPSLKKAARGKTNIRIQANVEDMHSLLSWADVAVGAAGSTSWEMAFLGLPSLVLILAENQKGPAASLGEAGAAINLGEAHELTAQEIAEALADLCQNPARRQGLSIAGRNLVDGRGAARVASLLEALDQPNLAQSMTLRKAGPSDAFFTWRIANDPAVRASSFNQNGIPWPDHLNWFKTKLSSPDESFWVIEVQGALVAQVRYSRVSPETAEVHFSVHPAFRGKGLGSESLRRTAPPACQELGTRSVRGVVIDPNEASAQAFRKGGFRCKDSRRVKGRSCSVFEFELESSACR